MPKDNEINNEIKRKGVFIEERILLLTELTPVEKMILAQIQYFHPKKCFMSNNNLGKKFGISGSRVSQIITKLVNLKFIDIELVYEIDSKHVKQRNIRYLIH